MEFTTKTEKPYLGQPVSLGQKGFSIGSCFAENIAGKLAVSGFDVVSNPFGVLYNPASIAGAFEILSTGKRFGEEDLIRNGDLWCSPLFHGCFSDPEPRQVTEGMNNAAERARKAVEDAAFVLISFGTPWTYNVSEEFAAIQEILPRGATVANCHKFPASYYERRRLGIDEIVTLFGTLSSSVLKGKKVIYTVSPVRYVGDGLHGSNLGKAILQLAVEKICESTPDSYYFPAYEILNDELRDYRFYGADMVHPSPLAVDYIWEKFRLWALSPDAAGAAAEIEKLSSAMHHRVQTPGTVRHLEYLRSMVEKTQSLGKKYPGAELSVQTDYFVSRLAKYENR